MKTQELLRGGVTAFRCAEGEVCCLAGTVWVTREGDPVDHVLRAGASLPVAGAGLVVVQALEPARVTRRCA